MTMTAGISVVIPTWNGLHLLQRFLPSILREIQTFIASTGQSAELIVVDDGSTDETVEWLASQAFVDIGGLENLRSGEPGASDMPLPSGTRKSAGTGVMAAAAHPRHLKYIRDARNRGFGYACNRGVEMAANRLVMLVNNDVELDQGCLSLLAENFSDANVFAAHCRVIDLNTREECGTGKLASFSGGFIRVHRSYILKSTTTEPGPHSLPLYSIFAGGGSAMFDRDKFLEMGGFEPLLAPFYWEDVELSYRAWKRGYKIVYEPRAVARHQISSTIGRLDASLVRRIQQRNRLIYHWINLHDGRMLASHLIWVLILLVIAPVTLRPGFLLAFWDAVRCLPQIKPRRRQEALLAKRTDRDVFSIFDDLLKRDDLVPYDRRSELKEDRETAATDDRP